MPDTDDLRRLGPPALRTAWLFQAIIAGPAFVFFGTHALGLAYSPYLPYGLYLPLRDLALALFTALIVFIVVVQRGYADPAPGVTARFELAKGLLASATWLWLLLDVVFFSARWEYWPDPRFRTRRIVFTLASSVVLFIFFYPTVFWTARLAREARNEAEGPEAGGPDEGTPLLQD